MRHPILFLCFGMLMLWLATPALAQKIDREGGHIWKHDGSMLLEDLIERCEDERELHRASAFYSDEIMHQILTRGEQRLKARITYPDRKVITVKMKNTGHGVDCDSGHILICDDARIVFVSPRSRAFLAMVLTAYPSNCRKGSAGLNNTAESNKDKRSRPQKSHSAKSKSTDKSAEITPKVKSKMIADEKTKKDEPSFYSELEGFISWLFGP